VFSRQNSRSGTWEGAGWTGYMWPHKLGQSAGANRPGDHTMRGNHTVHLCWKAHQPVDVLCELPPGKAV